MRKVQLWILGYNERTWRMEDFFDTKEEAEKFVENMDRCDVFDYHIVKVKVV